MRVNQTCTGRRDSNGHSQARRFRTSPVGTGDMHASHAPAGGVEDGVAGIIDMRVAKAGDQKRGRCKALGLPRQ